MHTHKPAAEAAEGVHDTDDVEIAAHAGVDVADDLGTLCESGAQATGPQSPFSRSSWFIVVPTNGRRSVMWATLMAVSFLIYTLELPRALFISPLMGPWPIFFWWVTALGFVASSTLLLVNTFTDPGILPAAPNHVEYEQGMGCGRCEILKPNSLLSDNFLDYISDKDPDIGSCYYCRTCHHLRPSNTSHCYSSNVCMMENDHYCSILGVCIAARNLRWFLLFNLCCACTATAAFLVLFWSLPVAALGGGAYGRRIGGDSPAGNVVGGRLIVLVLLLCCAFVASTSSFYFFITNFNRLIIGQTTRGAIKGLAANSSAESRGLGAIRKALFPDLPSLLPIYFADYFDLGEFEESGGGDRDCDYDTNAAAPGPHTPSGPPAAASPLPPSFSAGSGNIYTDAYARQDQKPA